MTAALVVVAALLLVPGAGAALALAAPGGISIEGRIGLAFGLGYALVAGVATLLTLAHAFTQPAFIAGVVLATVAAWALALRRASLRAHAAALRDQARAAPFTLAAGLSLLLAVAAVWRLHPPERNLAVRPAWRYWADGLELASAGHVPAQTQQWGLEIPTTVSKVVLNAFEGGVSFLLGADPLPPMHGIVTVVAVGLAAALLGLGRELGLGIFAPLVPALSVVVPRSLPLSDAIANHLKWYTAEDIGRMVAFSALLAGIYAVRTRGGWAFVVTGVLLALAALTHGIPTLVAGVLLVFYAAGSVVLERSELRRVLKGGAALFAVAGVCFVGILGLSGGDLGFQRAAAGGSFAGFPPSVDPTRSFAQGELLPPRVPKEGRFLISPGQVAETYANAVIERSGRARGSLLALALLGVASLVMVLRVRRFLPLAAVAWGLASTSLAVALFFSWRYDTRVPGDWGLRRLTEYGVLVPALLVPALLEAITGPFARRSRLVVAVLALAVAALAVGAAVARIPHYGSMARTEAGLAVIEHVRNVVPCDARMLANWRTAGTWQATTGRRAVTEGMAPFLRPQVMQRVLPILLGANAFFDDPVANRSFLSRERVEYLVVVDPTVRIGTHSGRVPEKDDAESVASLPNLHPVLRDRWVTIFAVGSNTVSRAGGQPGRCPL
jgi:hypothetical protein